MPHDLYTDEQLSDIFSEMFSIGKTVDLTLETEEEREAAYDNACDYLDTGIRDTCSASYTFDYDDIEE